MNKQPITEWSLIPSQVKELIKQGSTMFTRIRAALKTLPPAMPGYGKVWFNPKTQHIFFNVGDSDSEDLIRDWTDALNVKGVKEVHSEAETLPHKDKGPWLLVKQSNVQSLLNPLAQAGGWKEGFPANIFGGPNPLSATLASGALGAGVGYGAGWLAENVLPKRLVDKGRLRKTLGIAGGIAGAIPGIWGASVNLRNGKGILDPIGSSTEPEREITASCLVKSMSDLLDIFTNSDSIFRREMTKLADAFAEDRGFWGAGGNFAKVIDKDQFNRANWQDPFQPIPLKGTVAGIIEGASQIAGSPLVSPMDIARLGVGMGSGLVSGLVVGKTLGALAGITPEAQNALQRAGIWVGLVKNVVPMLFGHSESSTNEMVR